MRPAVGRGKPKSRRIFLSVLLLSGKRSVRHNSPTATVATFRGVPSARIEFPNLLVGVDHGAFHVLATLIPSPDSSTGGLNPESSARSTAKAHDEVGTPF